MVRSAVRNGIFDCGDNAYNGLFPRFFQHTEIDDVTVLSPVQHRVIFGDPAVSAISYEAVVRHLHVWSAAGRAVPTGYAGLYYQNASDCEAVQCDVVGCAISASGTPGLTTAS
jgi:hypothetical protein